MLKIALTDKALLDEKVNRVNGKIRHCQVMLRKIAHAQAVEELEPAKQDGSSSSDSDENVVADSAGDAGDGGGVGAPPEAPEGGQLAQPVGSLPGHNEVNHESFWAWVEGDQKVVTPEMQKTGELDTGLDPDEQADDVFSTYIGTPREDEPT